MDSPKLFQVAVGTKNPAKIEAVKLAFSKMFPEIECIVFPIKVDSHVGVQPYGFESTIQGAINRAKNAYFSVSIYISNGSITVGSGPGFEYPAKIVDKLLKDPNHHEIGTIIDEISGIANTKEHEGAIGLLSKNIFKRADILQYSVISALLPIKSPDLYSM